jgi:ubiquitin
LNDQIAALRALLLAATNPDAAAQQQIAEIAAQVRGEVEQARRALAPKTADFSLPTACQQMGAELCGRQDEDARISLANFSHPHKWRCRGCREEHDDDLMS